LRLLPSLLLVLLPLACGGPGTAPSPTPPVPPTDLPPVANMAGNWTGTVESDNFPARPITLVVVQAYNCVDGEWKDANGGWKGAISGLTSADSFSGQISLERSADGGGKCIASGTIAGPVDGDTIRWTADPLSAVGDCNGGLPQRLILSVKRQP
jgi:hypothetical protein